MCIVVEECDETAFWLELMEETQLMNKEQLEPIKREVNELLRIFSTTKKNLKSC